jgi:lipopolysaccharide export system protein LptA
MHTPSILPPIVAAALVAVVLATHAERSDRTKPLTMESDRPCTVDLVRHISICSGNVVIAQGTLQIRADRIELRETAEGYRQAIATGGAGQPAQYRQKRDASDETIEGRADRVEYDARADTLRFIGNALVRRSRGANASEEIQGNLIVWDNTAEVFSVQGGAVSPSNPGGRVRAVLTPRDPAASASAEPAVTLRPSNSLGERR